MTFVHFFSYLLQKNGTTSHSTSAMNILACCGAAICSFCISDTGYFCIVDFNRPMKHNLVFYAVQSLDHLMQNMLILSNLWHSIDQSLST